MINLQTYPEYRAMSAAAAEIIAMQVNCNVRAGDILRGEVRNHRR